MSLLTIEHNSDHGSQYSKVQIKVQIKEQIKEQIASHVEGDTTPHALRRHCFAVVGHLTIMADADDHKQEQLLPIDCSALSSQQAQDLSNALPFLACGEESAVHAFGSSLLKQVSQDEQAAMLRIAQDEFRHALWLERLRRALPPPCIHLPEHAMQLFFRRLLTRDAAKHFARVAALDGAVCQLLAPLLHQRASIQCAPELRSGLLAIVRDEARHVQVARQMAARLGMSSAGQTAINQEITQALDALLLPIASSLQRLSKQHEAIG